VNRPYPKVAYKFYGPFTVLERVGAAAYKLDLPADSKIHNVFHVSQLKSFTPDHSPIFSDISKLIDLTSTSTEPESILDRRLVKKGNGAVPQVLIKWSKLPATSATWEDYYVLKERFPGAVAWGQATSQGEGPVVTEPPKIIPYYRLSRSTWPLSNNKELLSRFRRVKPGKSHTTGSLICAKPTRRRNQSTTLHHIKVHKFNIITNQVFRT
jgi:hypothetical protein